MWTLYRLRLPLLLPLFRPVLLLPLTLPLKFPVLPLPLPLPQLTQPLDGVPPPPGGVPPPPGGVPPPEPTGGLPPPLEGGPAVEAVPPAEGVDPEAADAAEPFGEPVEVDDEDAVEWLALEAPPHLISVCFLAL
jgi:hypothetical protein